METVRQALDRYYPLSDKAKQMLEVALEPVNLKKGETLIAELEVSKYIYFIEQGALKNHYIDESGNKNVVWFGFEGDICFSLSAYFDIAYYHECMVLLEDAQLYRMPVSKIKSFYDSHIEWANWGRKFVEYHLIKFYREIDEHRPLDAKSRYVKLMEQDENIRQRVPLKDIASYLGVSPVTISRFRKQD